LAPERTSVLSPKIGEVDVGDEQAVAREPGSRAREGSELVTDVVQTVNAGHEIEAPARLEIVDAGHDPLEARRSRGRSGEVVDEIDAHEANPILEPEGLEVLGGVEERPTLATTEIQPGHVRLAAQSLLQKCDGTEPELAVVPVRTTETTAAVHRAVRDHRAPLETLAVEQLERERSTRELHGDETSVSLSRAESSKEG
jgi:hypothetical protein